MADRNMVNVTITVTQKEKKALRLAAVDMDTSISGVIRSWLETYQLSKDGDSNGKENGEQS